jgi:hypothetical protein
LYEDGEHQTPMRVGEPTDARTFCEEAMDAAPAERRRLLKSTSQTEGLVELIQRVKKDPQRVLQWLVENSERTLSWRELGFALRGREFPGQGAPNRGPLPT